MPDPVGTCVACIVNAGTGSSSAPVWLIPALTAAFALLGAWIAIGFDRRKAINQELIKRRLEQYDVVLPLANDLYCYLLCRGHFRALRPDTLLTNKREMDRIMYVHASLFSRKLLRSYHRFMADCFATYQGAGRPARLRARELRLKNQFGSDWQATWESSLAETFVTDAALDASYNDFVQMFGAEIGARRRPLFLMRDWQYGSQLENQAPAGSAA